MCIRDRCNNINKDFNNIITNPIILEIYLHILIYVINEYNTTKIDEYFKEDNIIHIFKIISGDKKLCELFFDFIIESTIYLHNFQLISTIFKILLKETSNNDIISNNKIIIDSYIKTGEKYVSINTIYKIIESDFIKLLTYTHSNNFTEILNMKNKISSVLFTETSEEQKEKEENIKKQIKSFPKIQQDFITYLIYHEPIITPI
jgi:hypothetical protein